MPDRKQFDFLFARGVHVRRTRRDECDSSRLRLFQQVVYLGHYLEGVGYVDYIGFAAGPAAIGIEIDGAAFVDEAPADYVRLFAVAAGGEAFGVAGSGAGLADLI